MSGHVGSELGLDDTRVTVRPRDTSPHYADLGSGDLPLGLVDVSDSLERSKKGESVWCWAMRRAGADGGGKGGKREKATASERGFVAESEFAWVYQRRPP